MTYEKFDVISDQLIPLIANPNIMSRLANLIVEKASCEPMFSPMYASLCQKIRSRCSLEFEDTGKNTTFRHIVLNLLQSKFESRNQIPQLIGLSPQDQEELLYRCQQKVTAVLRLICALHSDSRFLTSNIIHNCINELLSDAISANRDFVSIERVCYVISAVGSEIDNIKSKDKVDHYFLLLNEIKSDETIPKRTKFMIEVHRTLSFLKIIRT